MPEQSSMYGYLTWTKERIGEMDATLASLEAKAIQERADSKAKVHQLIAELKRRRDAFRAKAKTVAEADEAAVRAVRAQLESQWHAFEAEVKTYFDSVDRQIEQQHATFRETAAAQVKAWREAGDELRRATAEVAAARRADIDAAIKKIESDAAQAEARLQQFKQAKSESWAALGAALAESRKAFDRAIQQGWDAYKRAAQTKSPS
jgi:chromosome segregation ATPase